MLVDSCAQVMHHLLPDLVREQGLDDAECTGDDRDPDHPGDQPVQKPEVGVRKRIVDHRPQQKRGDDTERGREEDQAENACQPAAVGPEEGDDPPQVGTTNGRIGRPLRRLHLIERASPSTWHHAQGTERARACGVQALLFSARRGIRRSGSLVAKIPEGALRARGSFLVVGEE